MAFFGRSWDDEDEMDDEQIGPLSHWLEDLEEYDLDEIKDPGEKGADDNE